MSIRVGIYDFFANMIPGVFYMLVAAFGLNIFGIVKIDLAQIMGFSLAAFVTLLAVGFIVGQIIDLIGYKWFLLFRKRNSIARKEAFALFQQHYPWLEVYYRQEDWSLMLQAIRIQIPEATAEIDQHNALHIMLRNISLGLFLASLILIIALIVIPIHVANVVVAALGLTLSYLAIDRSAHRRNWFYLGIYEAFATNLLLQQQVFISKIQVKQILSEVIAEGEETEE
jgi:hypothetical protein